MELYSAFYDDLYEKRIWKRMGICLHIIESLCWTPEISNIVSQLCYNKTKILNKHKTRLIGPSDITKVTAIQALTLEYVLFSILMTF